MNKVLLYYNTSSEGYSSIVSFDFSLFNYYYSILINAVYSYKFLSTFFNGDCVLAYTIGDFRVFFRSGFF